MSANNRVRTEKAIKDCLLLAKELFGFDEHVAVTFRNTGRTAGWARLDATGYSLVFNSQMLSDDLVGSLIEDTVPHEIAHLVCYSNRTLGNNHDRGWQRVCIRLGGNGKRTHSYGVKKARRTRKAIYNINGTEMEIGATVHKNIQKGKPYFMRSNKAQIKPEYFTGKVVMK